MRRRTALPISALALGLALAGCSSSDTDTATTETEAAAAAGEKKSGAVTMIMRRVIYQSSGKANSDS